MSPKCDLKHESIDDSCTLADVAGTRTASNISSALSPLPHMKHEFFKFANNTLSDDLKTKCVDVSPHADSEKKNLYVNVTVKVISNSNTVFMFPWSICKIIYVMTCLFFKFDDFCSIMADHMDKELIPHGLRAVFISPDTHYGSRLDLDVATFDQQDIEEFLLTEKI
jgi:hypothetical protein